MLANRGMLANIRTLDSLCIIGGEAPKHNLKANILQTHEKTSKPPPKTQRADGSPGHCGRSPPAQKWLPRTIPIAPSLVRLVRTEGIIFISNCESPRASEFIAFEPSPYARRDLSIPEELRISERPITIDAGSLICGVNHDANISAQDDACQFSIPCVALSCLPFWLAARERWRSQRLEL